MEKWAYHIAGITMAKAEKWPDPLHFACSLAALPGERSWETRRAEGGEYGVMLDALARLITAAYQ